MPNHNQLNQVQLLAVESIDRITSALSPEDRLAITQHMLAHLDPLLQVEATASAMGNLEPGKQPFPIFKELTRLTVLPTYEAAIVREAKEGHEILLRQRQGGINGADWWEGQWHVPGVVMLETDTFESTANKDTDFSDFSSVRHRLISEEMNGAVVESGEIRHLPAVGRNAVRGNEVTVRELVMAELPDHAELPESAKFFNIRNILRNPPAGGFVESHETFIQGVAGVLGIEHDK